MNNSLFKKAQDTLSSLRLKNKIIREERKKEIYSKISRIEEIDKEISNLALELTKSMLIKKNNDEALEQFKKGSAKLNMEKYELLVANEYDPDYLDEVPSTLTITLTVTMNFLHEKIWKWFLTTARTMQKPLERIVKIFLCTVVQVLGKQCFQVVLPKRL